MSQIIINLLYIFFGQLLGYIFGLVGNNSGA